MNNAQSPNLQGLSMVAPESQSQYERKDNSQIVRMTAGSYICRLYGIVDLGTQHSQMYQKDSRKVALLFEFPHIVQDFYVRKPGEEAKLQPTMVKVEETFSMASKANLRKLIEGGLGRRFDEKSAKEFNIFELLDKWFVANVILDPDKKDPNNFYERIQTLMPYNENFKIQGVEYKNYNDPMAYSIQLHGFAGANWLSLWNKMRSKLKQSREGQAHAAKGGVFEEPPKDNAQSATGYAGPTAPGQAYQPSAPQPMQGAPTPMGSPAANGPVNPVATQPVSNAVPPTAPSAPAAAPQKQFVITNENKDLNSWLNGGWTKEMMVEQGHAQWVDSVQ